MTRGREYGLALLLGASVAGCSAAAPRTVAESEPTPHVTELVHLDFEDRVAPVGEIVPSVANRGTADLGSGVVTHAGGRIVRAAGRDSGYAIRFPEHTGTVGAPAAMLLLHSRADADLLNPGDRDFAFGADVLPDPISAGSETDDGNNIIQRGLYEDDIQYKLQLDGGVPSCRLAGSEGIAVIVAQDPVPAEAWHRITCERRGDVVSLEVERLDEPGDVVLTEQVTEPVGALVLRRSTPLVIGGKVDADGRVVVSSTDQFNGVIDNVSFMLLD